MKNKMVSDNAAVLWAFYLAGNLEQKWIEYN